MGKTANGLAFGAYFLIGAVRKTTEQVRLPKKA